MFEYERLVRTIGRALPVDLSDAARAAIVESAISLAGDYHSRGHDISIYACTGQSSYVWLSGEVTILLECRECDGSGRATFDIRTGERVRNDERSLLRSGQSCPAA